MIIEVLQSNKKQIEQIKSGFMEFAKLLFALPFTCGYTSHDGITRQFQVHDHDGVLRVYSGLFGQFTSEPYDEKKHGKIIDFLFNGDVIPELWRDGNKKDPVHRHGSSTRFNAWEYNREPAVKED